MVALYDQTTTVKVHARKQLFPAFVKPSRAGIVSLHSVAKHHELQEQIVACVRKRLCLASANLNQADMVSLHSAAKLREPQEQIVTRIPQPHYPASATLNRADTTPHSGQLNQLVPIMNPSPTPSQQPGMRIARKASRPASPVQANLITMIADQTTSAER
jgi:hypothetical protein